MKKRTRCKIINTAKTRSSSITVTKNLFVPLVASRAQAHVKRVSMVRHAKAVDMTIITMKK